MNHLKHPPDLYDNLTGNIVCIPASDETLLKQRKNPNSKNPKERTEMRKPKKSYVKVSVMNWNMCKAS